MTFTLIQCHINLPNIYMLSANPFSISYRSGIFDNFGAKNMMMEALDKVEKQIKKPLLRSDKKNMALLHAEFAEICNK